MIEYILKLKEKIKNKLSYSLLNEQDKEADLSNTKCPEEDASIFSRLSFGWTQRMLIYGYFNTLAMKDIPDLPNRMKVENTSPIFSTFKYTSSDKGYGLIKFIYRNFVLKRHKLSIIIQIFASALAVLSPLYLKLFILYVQQSEKTLLSGFGYCLMLFASSLGLTLSQQYTYWYGMMTGMEVKGGLSDSIYKKTLKLSNSGKRAYQSGAIMNLISTDCSNFSEFFWIDHLLVVVFPLQIFALLALLCWIIGYSGLVGFLVMLLSLPLSTYLSSKVSDYQLASLGYSDERCNMINEMINSIRLIKLYAWERIFLDKIEYQRQQQLNQLYKRTIFWILDKMVAQISSALVLISTFSVFSLTGNPITLEIAFTSITIFVNLRSPLDMLPQAIQRLISLVPSSKRICQFLYEASEIELQPFDNSSGSNVNLISTHDVIINNATFDWNEKSTSFSNSNSLNDGINDGGYGDGDMMEVELINEMDNNQVDEASITNNNDGEDYSNESYVLKNINVRAPAGKLTVVIGAVGTGKSSLVNALIGEIYKVSGTIEMPKNVNVSFTAQQPFLANSTLRDNILFGKPMNMERYKKVIQACGLLPDLASMPGKDLIELGAKGINISGGQKQRISLARALYSDSDINILDEPLSAVDPEVATHLFNHCIQGPLMNNKTRILVTHQLQFIPSADHIVVLENGNITQGTYLELKEKGFDFESIMKAKKLNMENSNVNKNSEDTTNNIRSSQDLHNSTESTIKKSTGYVNKIINVNDVIVNLSSNEQANSEQESKLLVVEDRSKGAVSLDVYKKYIKYGSSMLFFISTIAMYIISQCIFQFSDFWLSIWSQHKIDGATDSFYIKYYILFIALFSICLAIRYVMIFKVTFTSSKNLHHKLLKSIGFAPCVFYDTNPTGRILNRFTKDIGEVDLLLMIVSDVLYCGSTVLVAIGMMIFINPLICLPFTVLVLVYFVIQKVYRAPSRELKRLESITRSPIFSLLTETYNGLVTIRSFREQTRFIKDMQNHINVNLRLFFYSFSIHRWIGIRLELISSLVVFLSSLFSLFNSNPGLSVLAVTTAIGMAGYLNWCVRQYVECEMRMSSVERIQTFIEIPREGSEVIGYHDIHNYEMELPLDWPSKGEIEFRNVEIRYRPTLPPSLNNLSFSIRSNEKIGIVGTSGSGKSTLMLALFRMVETSSGTITIDGIDISKISLHRLRSSIGICPQEPFIFSGSIRFNIDPFNKYSDDEIWKSLEKVELKDAISSMPLKLETTIQENGDGLSFGQKQLLCLARIILKDLKLVFFDEHSSGIDYKTGELLNKTVEENIKCTTLTIAHRLDTIMDSDRIFVIERGELIETYDKNNSLSNGNNSNSKFKKLVKYQTNYYKNK